MKTLKITLALCVYTLGSTVAHAYELTTHGWITLKAYERSALSPSNPRSIQPALGFDRLLVDRPFVAPFASRNGTPNKCVTSSTVCAKAPSRKVLRWSTQAQ